MDLDDLDTVDELPARPRRAIPKADRELLELAARALGAVRVEDVDGEEWLILHFADGSIRHGWNPLIHSDDTFNMQIELWLDVTHWSGIVYVNRIGGADGISGHIHIAEYWGESNSDRLTGACRAITRAAAEIGKAMK